MRKSKPGDLCIVVGSPVSEVNGHIVTAIRRFFFNREPHWEIEPKINGYWWAGAEKRLIRITPPAGSVTDEEVRDLYAPVPTKEHA